MELPPIQKPHIQPDAKDTKAKEKEGAGGSKEKGVELKMQDDLNAKIIQAHQDVKITAGDKNMELVFRAAIDRLNEILAPSIGDEAIQEADPDDYTPEKVADRIVSFATAFFDSFRKQHEEMNDQEALDAYMQIIGDAVDQGFNEAKDILEGLKVLEGDVADTIDQTYKLVQEGLEKFREGFNYGDDQGDKEESIQEKVDD